MPREGRCRRAGPGTRGAARRRRACPCAAPRRPRARRPRRRDRRPSARGAWRNGSTTCPHRPARRRARVGKPTRGNARAPLPPAAPGRVRRPPLRPSARARLAALVDRPSPAGVASPQPTTGDGPPAWMCSGERPFVRGAPAELPPAQRERRKEISAMPLHIRVPRSAAVLLAVLVAAVVAPRSASTQALYGAIVGNVADQSGAPVPGATVTATNEGTGLKVDTTTEKEG